MWESLQGAGLLEKEQDEAALGHAADAGVGLGGVVALLASDPLARPTLMPASRITSIRGCASDRLLRRPEPLRIPKPGLPASHEKMHVKYN